MPKLPSPRRSAWLLPMVIVVCAVMVLPASAVLSPRASPTTGNLSSAVNPASLTSHAASGMANLRVPSVSPLNPASFPTRASSTPSPSMVAGSTPEEQWLRNLLEHDGASKSPPLVSLPSLAILDGPSSPSTMVHPFYQSQPAPMGLADFGLGTNGPYAYNTSHVNAQIVFNAPPNATAPGSSGVIAPSGQNLGYVGSPYEFSIQLNTVTNNMTIPGSNDGTFWTQNVLDMNNTGLHFVDDVFNLTGPVTVFEPGSIATGCGMNVDDILATYGGVYQCVGTTISISPADFPLTISLYNNASVNSDNMSQVSFGYRFAGAGGFLETGVSDVVVFANPNATTPVNKPGFSVDGYQTTPSGLLRDSEIILGGPIGGTNAVFNSLSASMSLLYSNVSVGGWKEIPAAYDFGTDTGETSVGVAAYWTAGHLEELNQGPSLLYGLWGGLTYASVPSGDIQFQGSISPSYGFVFLSNVAPGGLGTNLTLVPTTATGTFDTLIPPTVPPGTEYYVQSWADGFAELNSTPFSTSQLGYTITLTSDHGFNRAPLYANGNPQAASLALNVLTAATPPFDYSGLTVDLNLTFNHLTEYGFPTFVLFQEQAVTSVVHVNDVTQGPDSSLATLYYYNYASPSTGFLSPGPTLDPNSRPGYSQSFQILLSSNAAVTNETLVGPLAYPDQPGSRLPAFGTAGAVLLWKDSAVTIDHVSAEEASYGIFVGDSSTIVARNTGAASGSNGVDDIGSTGTMVWNSTASGSGSFGVYVLSSTDGRYLWLNTSAEGTGLYAGSIGLIPYYSVPGATAASITHLSVTSDAIGAILLDSDANLLAWANATSGAVGGISELSELTDYVDITASSATGVEIFEDLEDTVTGLTVHDNSTETGAVVELSEFTIFDRVVIDGAETGLLLVGNELTYLEYVWDNTSSAQGVSAIQNDDTEIYSLHVNASGTVGVALTNDTVFFGEYAYTTGPTTYQVTGGTEIELEFGSAAIATGVTATNRTGGIELDTFDSSTITATSATNASVGVILENSSWVTVSQTTASVLSIAVAVLNGSQNVQVTQTTVSDESLGVGVEGAGLVGISGVTATNSTLSSPWNLDPFFHVPAAAVATEDTYQIQISNVVATDYPIGLYDLESGYAPPGPGSLSVQDLNATGGWYAVMMNGTYGAVLSGIGAFRDYEGVWMGEGTSPFVASADDNYVSNSNFVDDTSYGVAIWDGYGNYIWGSNFIGDNGATDVYSVAHLQAFSAPGDYNYFDSPYDPIGNYWADWHTYASDGQLAPYIISTTTEDEEPITYAAGDVAAWFYEYGLPSGTTWSVTFNGATESTTNDWLEFGAPAGIYSFTTGTVGGYTASPATGNVTTTSGPATLYVTYTAIPPATPTYPVTVSETGLPKGTAWSAIVGGTPGNSSSSSIVVTLPAGTYTYQIPSIAGYTATPSSGSAIVTGAYSIAVAFTAVTYAVTVTESGLSTGTAWSATVNGMMQSTVGTAVTFYLPNGSYTYSLSSVSGYSLTGGTGSISVNGAPAGASGAYTLNTTPSVVSSSTYNSGFAVAIAIAIIALLIGLLALFWRHRARSAENPPPPSAWTPPPPAGTPTPPPGTTGGAEQWSEGPANPPS